MKKKPINRKHRYSSWALVFMIALIVFGSVVAIDSRELDVLCADNNSLLKRLDGVWQCYNESVAVYAEMYGTDLEVIIDAVDTYYNVTNLTLGSVSNVNFSNSTFIIITNGTYAINSQFSFSDGAINEFHLALGVNGIKELHCHTERKLGTGGDVGSASFTCIDNFTVGDELTVMIENVVSSSNPTLHDINLNIHLIGGAEIDYTEMDPVWVSERGDYVPYTGATTTLDLGVNKIKMSPINLDAFFIADNVVTGTRAIGIGSWVEANGTDSVAIGFGVDAYAQTATSVGMFSKATAPQASALGYTAKAEGQGATAVGFGSTAQNPSSTAVGAGAVAHGQITTAIGGATAGVFGNPDKAKGIIAIGMGDYNNQLNDSIGMGIGIDELLLLTNTTAHLRRSLAIGNNTADNLTLGDINASILYVDAITYKSPAFTCSGNWCEIRFPQYQDSLYLERDGEWNIIQIIYKDVSYTPQEFNQGPCDTNQNTRAICDALIEKIQNFKDKKAHDDAARNCETQSEFHYYDGSSCQFDAKRECEQTGYSVYLNNICYENEFYKCQHTNNMAWNYALNSCERIIPQPIPPPSMTPQECLQDITKKWENNLCVGLEE